MRRVLFWLLIAGFIWLILTRFAQIERLVAVLAQGQWLWVLVAVVLQLLYYVGFTELYRVSFETVGVDGSIRDLLPVMFASVFANLAPTAGAGGAALFVDDAVRRGQSAVRATAGVLLAQIADYSAFTAVLIAGLIVLFLQHELRIYEVVATGALVLVIGGMTAVLLLGLISPTRLRRLLARIRCLVNRIAGALRHPDFLPEVWIEQIAEEFRAVARAVAGHPQQMWYTLVIGFIVQSIDIASLYVLFLAFHHPVRVGILIAGYGMSILFTTIALTPQGVGVVESVTTLVFASLGVPLAQATVITFAYRGLSLWLPLTIGFVLLRYTGSFRDTPRGAQDVR